MANFVKIAETTQVPNSGDRIAIELDGDIYIAVFNVDSKFYAVEDICTHDDYELHTGELDGYALECIHHGAVYDIRDGSVLSFPATRAVKIYEVRVEGENILVNLD